MKKIISLFLLSVFFAAGCSQTGKQMPEEIISLDEPPKLTITVDNKSISAVRGTYSWEIDNGGGNFTCIDSDSGPPPELVEFQEEVINVLPSAPIALDFEVKPENYQVGVWQDKNTILQQVDNGIIISPRQKGLVIYEVHATWKEGNCYYAFSVFVD